MASEVMIRQRLGVAVFFIIFSLTCYSSFAVSERIRRSRKSLEIKEINREGPYIGLITVYFREENAFFASKVFQPHTKHPFVDLSGSF